MKQVSHKDIRYTILPYLVPVEPWTTSDKHGILIGILDRDKHVFHLADSSQTCTDHWSIPIIETYKDLGMPQRYWYVLRGHPEDTLTYVHDVLIQDSVHTLHIYKYDLWNVESKEGWIAVVLQSEVF